MRLEKFTINNIGPFFGETTFDFSTSTKRKKPSNVILIGGKNGCGKTNILESLRLCLHGKRGIGTRLSEAQYNTEIKNRIHKHDNVSDAYVQLDFSMNRDGAQVILSVTRSWSLREESITEKLSIAEDGEALSSVPAPFWQDFLDEIIPPNLAQLFFFDGERIQELASEDRNEASQALIEAVENLFGLSLVNRLVADLSQVERQVGSEGGMEEAKQIAGLHQQHSERTAELDVLQERHLKNFDKIEREKTKQSRLEDKLRSSGGGYAKQREKLTGKKERALAKLETLEAEMKQKSDELFPFIFCSDLIGNLKEEIEENQEIQALAQSKGLLEKKAKALRQAFSNQALARIDKRLSDKQKVSLRSYVEGVIGNLFSSKQARSDVRTIELGGRDYRHMLGWIDSIKGAAKTDIRKLSLDLEIVTRELSDVNREIEKAPSDEELKPLFEELRVVSERVGTLISDQDTIDEEMKEVRLRRDEIERQLKKLAEKALDSDDLGMIFKRSVAAREAAKRFGVELTHRKLENLSAQVLRIFNLLARKQEVVSHIKINPKTYQLQVFTRHGGLMPKDRFSAGERQILAISILWALAQMSGRALPMVIDTPLGRLDSEHRKKLVENYFTKASHQVIILSTDEEVDEHFYEQLRPSLAHSYYLDFDSKNLRTNVSTGYFWGSREVVR